MSGSDPRSTLAPPSRSALRRFQVGQVGDDTIETYLTKGWSLAICCKACERLVEWTPSMLAARFEDRPGLRIAHLAERLACIGDGGCGSREVAVFPHSFDGPWLWRRA